MEQHHFIPEAGDIGKRADIFLAERIDGMSRSGIQLLMENGGIWVNDIPCRKKRLVCSGDIFTVMFQPPRASEIQPENLPLDIVYEDDDLLVVNKSKGMCVHPAPGNEKGTLVNALLYHCGHSLSGINGVVRPGIVHRLDKDTSGLLIVAKNDRTHIALAEQISSHSFDRQYEAVVFGAFAEPNGTICLPIGRSEKDRKKMAVSEKGRYAETRYRTLAVYSFRGVSYSRIELTLFTGRTHQIRVHCASRGHPVAGDCLYGAAERDSRWFPELRGQCLHAKRIGFVHPGTGKYMEFHADPPEYFRGVLTTLASWDTIITSE